VIGAINANHALLAKRAGFRAIYLSGGGVAAGSLGLPDLGINNLEDVLTDVRRITDVCDLPLLVDIDTGFGPSAFNVARTVKSLIKAGAAACHIEDQVGAKRCGHRPGKEIVSRGNGRPHQGRRRAKTDPDFFLIARTDAIRWTAWTPPSSAPSPASRRCRHASSRGHHDLDMYRRSSTR
jgi:methylisocitrate lyase